MNHTDPSYTELDKKETKISILASLIAISMAFTSVLFIILNWNFPYQVINAFFNIGIFFSIFWFLFFAASTLILDRKSTTYRKDLAAIGSYFIITLIFTAGVYTLRVNLS